MNCVLWSIGDVSLQGMGHLLPVPASVIQLSPMYGDESVTYVWRPYPGMPNKAFTPSKRVESVAVLSVPEYDDFVIENYSATLLGMAATKAAYQGRLRKSIMDTGFTFGGEFTTELAAELTSAGLKVETVPVKREGFGPLKSYEGIKTSAQTILDVSSGGYSVSYFADIPVKRTDYRPAMFIRVVLVDKASGEVLYRDLIKYGKDNPLLSGTELPAPEGSYFSSAEELVKDDNAARGLRVAVQQVSSYIAEKLRNGNVQITAAAK